MIRALIFDLFTPRFYPHPTSFSPLLCSKLSAFLAKEVVLWGAQLEQKGAKDGGEHLENDAQGIKN